MAAVGNELITVVYPGGTARAARGLLETLFAPQQRKWKRTNTDGRRPYKSRQRSASAAGEPVKVVLEGGVEYTLRVTGSHTAFLDFMIARAIVPVLNVVSERGTEYGPEVDTLPVVPNQ